MAQVPRLLKVLTMADFSAGKGGDHSAGDKSAEFWATIGMQLKTSHTRTLPTSSFALAVTKNNLKQRSRGAEVFYQILNGPITDSLSHFHSSTHLCSSAILQRPEINPFT